MDENNQPVNQPLPVAQPEVQPVAALPAPAPVLANQDIQQIAQAVAGILQPTGSHPLQAGLPSSAQPGKSNNYGNALSSYHTSLWFSLRLLISVFNCSVICSTSWTNCWQLSLKF